MKIVVEITYKFKQKAYDPDIVGCDVKTEEEALKLDKAFIENEGMEAFLDWLDGEGIDYSERVEDGETR